MPAHVESAAWRILDALRWAEEQLTAAEEPEISARLLLAHVLCCSLTDLFVHPERVLTAAESIAYRAFIARRADHEPVAYLVGHRPFFDLDLQVDQRVLIPRQETELLVEQALAEAKRWPAARVVDVGAGSGAIAVCLAAHLPQAIIFATDISTEALQVAQANARRCQVEGRITFLCGDLLAPLSAPVDMIVANLPYVSAIEYDALPLQVRLYEPRQALLAGVDGLDVIRALLAQAPLYLSEKGAILLEIGAGQGAAVANLARAVFPVAQVEIIQDYARLDRIVRIGS